MAEHHGLVLQVKRVWKDQQIQHVNLQIKEIYMIKLYNSTVMAFRIETTFFFNHVV